MVGGSRGRIGAGPAGPFHAVAPGTDVSSEIEELLPLNVCFRFELDALLEGIGPVLEMLIAEQSLLIGIAA